MALKAIIAAGLGVLALAACGGSVPSAAPAPTSVPPTRSPELLPSPTLTQNVKRAMNAGPGFLDYCPAYTGVRPARFQLYVPGDPIAPGWCATFAHRRRIHDYVSFAVYWDGKQSIHRDGTWHISYSLTRRVTIDATPVPRIIGQGGVLPP